MLNGSFTKSSLVTPHIPFISKKCNEVNLLPLARRFELNDLVFLHKVIYNLCPIELPSYLSFYQGNSRLRKCHLDSRSLVSSITPMSGNCRAPSNPLAKSFFYRTHNLWNNLPFDIRTIVLPGKFKTKVIDFLWKDISNGLDDSLMSNDYLLDCG